jgi:AcrR family transcriptional regulator
MTTSTRVRPLRADVREQIVTAAATEFAEHGYAGTSVAQVAARAGFTKGAVYSNFGGKPELFVAATQAYFAETVVAAVTGALSAAASTGAGTRSRAMAHALADSVLKGERWPALLAEFRTIAARDPEVSAVYTELRLTQRAQLVEALRHASEQVPLRDGLDLEVAAALLLTCVQSLTVERAAAPEATPRLLAEALFAHVLDGILA